MKKELWLSKNTPTNLLILIIFSMTLWGLQFFFPVQNPESLQSYRGLLVINNIPVAKYNTLFIISGFIFYMINLFTVYKINSRFNIIDNSGFLIIWLYIFITSTDYRYLILSPELVSVSLFLFSLFFFFRGLSKPKAYNEFFYIGFLMIFASVLQSINLFLIIFFIIALPAFKNHKWREPVLLFTGIITGGILITGILYLTDSIEIIKSNLSLRHILPGFKVPAYNLLLLDFIIGILLINSLFFLITRYGFLKIATRRYFKVIVLLLFFSAGLFLIAGMSPVFRFHLAIPVVFILTFFLVNTRMRILALTINWFIFLIMTISEVLAIINSISG